MKGASRMNNKELAIYAGNKIKEFRKIKNWTQQQLATKLNTTKATISNYETGYRSPKKDMLFTIADVFNISIDDFFPTPTAEQNTPCDAPADHPSKDLETLQTVFNQLDEVDQNKLLQIAQYLLMMQDNKGIRQSKFPTHPSLAHKDSGISIKDIVGPNYHDHDLDIVQTGRCDLSKGRQK